MFFIYFSFRPFSFSSDQAFAWFHKKLFFYILRSRFLNDHQAIDLGSFLRYRRCIVFLLLFDFCMQSLTAVIFEQIFSFWFRPFCPSRRFQRSDEFPRPRFGACARGSVRRGQAGAGVREVAYTRRVVKAGGERGQQQLPPTKACAVVQIK